MSAPITAKATIYARFSTDKQSDASTADQIRICRQRAELLGATVGAVHTDEAVSGSTPVELRQGGKALMADAAARRFDVLLLEGLDRLSRDMVEQERLVRRLEYGGVRIIGVSDGYDSCGSGKKIQRTMRGLINEIYLDDLRAKTHRGLTGKVLDGYSAGGKSYGYTSTHDGRGHTLQVVPAQAKVIRQIFEWYGQEQWSIEKITHQLNADRTPSPRGKLWAKSAIYGSPAKGSGILNNPLYKGQAIWNRAQWVKDPDTGQRTRLDRPKSEWHVIERPELRIVSDEAWRAVYARMHATRSGKQKLVRNASLLGGILRCGHCGGPLNAVNQRLYGCKNHKESGPMACSGVQVGRKSTEDRLLAVVRDELLSPSAIVEFQAAWKALSSSLASSSSQQNQAVAKRLGEIAKEIGNLVQAIATVGISSALQSRLHELETEQMELQSRKQASGPKQDDYSLAKVKAMVLQLEASLKKDSAKSRQLLGELLGQVKVSAASDGTFAELEAPRHQLLAASGLLLKGVAGARSVPQLRIRLR